MNTTGGFVLLYRRLWEHPAFQGRTEAAVFAWMISAASWQRVEVRYKGRALTLERGQLAVSMRDLASAWNWSEAKARRYLKRLAGEGMADARHDAGVTIVTLRNYDSFQAWPVAGDAHSDAPIDAPVTQHRRAAVAQNKEENQGNHKDKDDCARTSAKPIRLSSDREDLAYEALDRLLVTPGWSFRKFIDECPPAAGISIAHIGRVRDGQSVPEAKRLAVLSTALRLATEENII